MSSDEEYLDNLLKSAMNPKTENALENVDSIEEDFDTNHVSFGMENIDKIIINDVNELIEDEIIDAEPSFEEPIVEDILVDESLPELPELETSSLENTNTPIEVTPLDDNPNRQLSADEIAALFSGVNNNNNIETDVEQEDVSEQIVSDTFNDESINQEELFSVDTSIDNSMFNEEMEFDLDSLENIDDLLGIRDKSAAITNDEIDLSSPLDSIDQNLDITDIIDNMEENDDEDLAEINELLKKSDNNEMVEEDELLALLEEVNPNLDFDEEEAPEVDMSENIDDIKIEDKKERKKLFNKKDRNKNKREKDLAIESELSIDGEDKKIGVFQKMFHTLTMEVEDEEVNNIDGESINKKKRSKNKKKSKNKPNIASNEEILDDLDQEDLKKKLSKGKAKKEKKPKKVKKEKIVETVEDSGKKLPKKMVMSILILCVSILTVCYLLASFFPPLIAKQSARRAFYNGEFDNTYKKLQSLELSESDTILYKKAEILSQLKHKNDAAIAYMYVDSKDKALNSLLEGIIYYQEKKPSIDNLEINEQATELYHTILINLKETFDITEEDALVFIDLDNVSYTDDIHAIVSDEITDVIDISNNSIPQDEKTEILDGELDE